MFSTRNGLIVDTPLVTEENTFPAYCPTLDPVEIQEQIKFFDEYGFLHLRSVLNSATCESINALWDSEVKSSTQPIYRQATALLEKNNFDKNGWVMNPILNLQSLKSKYFPA